MVVVMSAPVDPALIHEFSEFSAQILAACSWHVCAVQSQKAVSAYFTSEQILPFSFAEQNSGHSDLTVPICRVSSQDAPYVNKNPYWQ